MSEFKGKAGRIFVEKCEDDNVDQKPYEVWFEDFCIIGLGRSELDALQNAAQHVADIGWLVAEALAATKAGPVAGGES